MLICIEITRKSINFKEIKKKKRKSCYRLKKTIEYLHMIRLRTNVKEWGNEPKGNQKPAV